MADADGSNPVHLTHFTRGKSGSPRWSPDGEWVAFDQMGHEQNGIFLVRSAGGTPRRLTTDRAENFGPSWSRDGKWIYFGSNRGGKDQVWKMPTSGGEAVQITKYGGARALEAADGKWLYYTKGNDQDGIWRMPLQGGLEEPVLEDLPSGWYVCYWALVENGIYYLNTRNGVRQSVEFSRCRRTEPGESSIFPNRQVPIGRPVSRSRQISAPSSPFLSSNPGATSCW